MKKIEQKNHMVHSAMSTKVSDFIQPLIEPQLKENEQKISDCIQKEIKSIRRDESLWSAFLRGIWIHNDQLGRGANDKITIGQTACIASFIVSVFISYFGCYIPLPGSEISKIFVLFVLIFFVIIPFLTAFPSMTRWYLGPRRKRKRLKAFTKNPNLESLDEIFDLINYEQSYFMLNNLIVEGEILLKDDRPAQRNILEERLNKEVGQIKKFYFESELFTKKREKLVLYLEEQRSIIAAMKTEENKSSAEKSLKHIEDLIIFNNGQEKDAHALVDSLQEQSNEVLALFDQAVLNEKINDEFTQSEKIAESLSIANNVLPQLQERFSEFQNKLTQALAFQDSLLELRNPVPNLALKQ